LTFAVDVTASGFNLNTVGVILMVAGPLAWCCRCYLEQLFAVSAEPDGGRTRHVVEERRIERDLP
jgi:hypothetical protein